MVTLEQIEGKTEKAGSQLDMVRDNFVESIGQLSASLGLSRLAGQLYAMLYISGRPLSLDDMVETLKISKGNASVNIRELEKWGAVKKVWVKGSRKDFYEAELDVFKVVSSRLKEGLHRRLSETWEAITRVEKLLEESNSSLSEQDKQTLKAYKERIKKVKELHNMAQGMLRVVSKAGSISLLRKMLL